MLLLLTPERQGRTGVFRFRLTIPARPSWGSIQAVSGNPATQMLARLSDWRPGLPIPEGDYLLGPLDVARYHEWGKPDWEAHFDGAESGPIFRDLIPCRANAHSRLRYGLRTYPGRRALLSSDVYLLSQADVETFYDWSVRAPLDLLQVNYGLSTGREPRRIHRPQLSRLHLLSRVDF